MRYPPMISHQRTHLLVNGLRRLRTSKVIWNCELKWGIFIGLKIQGIKNLSFRPILANQNSYLESSTKTKNEFTYIRSRTLSPM